MTIRARKLLVLVLLSVLCIGCDRATKRVATEELKDMETVSLVGGTVRLQYAENTGAFLGLAGDLPPAARMWILNVGTGVLLAALMVYLVRRYDLSWQRFVPLCLVLAGGVGNLIDRVAAGYVVDFVSIGVGPLRTGIFNVADVAITVGAVWLFVTSWRRDPESASGAPSAS